MTVFQLTAHEWWLLVHRSKFKANGRIYITTQRLVFCADKGTTQHDTVFEAFATDQTNGDDVTPIHWKVSFNNGGTGTFLTMFLKLMEQKKKGDIDASFVAKQQQKAFVDPNDPSVIYVTQPVRPPRKPMASC
ncbi:hypothetical protein DYB28_003702 [Aphanomyces astaci]|uniref:GRAM domain-containing protein n=1 Tax=Aphanomyces astaci TaxID=112090 RepID=A0A9X8DQC0_APHAT|nr:hypothetical protein DYB28_003702 [Aphanomyces astaci]